MTKHKTGTPDEQLDRASKGRNEMGPLVSPPRRVRQRLSATRAHAKETTP